MLIKFGFHLNDPHYYTSPQISGQSHRRLSSDDFRRQNNSYVIGTLMQRTSGRGELNDYVLIMGKLPEW